MIIDNRFGEAIPIWIIDCMNGHVVEVMKMEVSKLIELSNQKRVAEEYAKSSEWNDDVRIYAIERIFEKPILFDIIETA